MSDAPELLPCPFCGADMQDFHGHSFAHPLTEGRDGACILAGLSFSYRHSRWGTDETIRWNRRATPAALAASPEVAALIREAEARGMERAAENIAAIERLAISASIASCTCLTKTPDITFHFADCRYVKLQYIIAQCEDFRDSAEAAALRGKETT